MYKVIVVSHGDLGKSMLESAQMICGIVSPDEVSAFSLKEGDSPDTLYEKLDVLLAKWQGEDVLLFSDLRSGTPFNTAVRLMQRYPFQHISGVNLALLIESLMNRESMAAKECSEELMAMCEDTFLYVNPIVEEPLD
jgi:PTS system mannose-specific IIA component